MHMPLLLLLHVCLLTLPAICQMSLSHAILSRQSTLLDWQLHCM